MLLTNKTKKIMTDEEQKKYIEGYINGLMSGDNTDLYVFDNMEDRIDTLVLPLEAITGSTVDNQITSLVESINNMLEGENLPYSAYINIEVVLSPEERSK